MKRYMNMPDTRPLDDWGIPIGEPYDKKKWDALTPDEMMADFEWKSDILASMGEEVDCDTFYQDYLFRELYAGDLEGNYKILLTEYNAETSNKMHKVDVDDICDYLHLSDVALSPCLFYDNWRRKKLLNYVSAFVLDIDKLRPQNLQRFFELFEKNRLLTPTFIANSGSGVHFYYLLDKMLPVDSTNHEANNQIAEKIYVALYDDVIKKEKWNAAQRHWIGQDYRVVNSKTKFQQTAQIFKVGDTYTIEQLISYYGITIDPKKNYATQEMVKYAGSIARELKIDPPDYSEAKKTYEFIKEHKDAAYQSRMLRKKKQEERLKKKKKRRKMCSRRAITWYQNTLRHMYDNTQPGYRFSSMKALAMIAHKEKISRDAFVNDLQGLVEHWSAADWHGDDFNSKNVEAIVRFFDNAGKYGAKSETLEEWLGYEFKRLGTKRREEPLSQKDHLEEARAIRDIRMERKGIDWRNNDGAPTKLIIVKEWRAAHPEGKKIDCERDTGLSRHTVLKWWDVPEPSKQYRFIPDGVEEVDKDEIEISIENSSKYANALKKMVEKENENE